MLRAHLSWAEKHIGDLSRLNPHLADAECAGLLSGRMLSTDWMPFRCLIALDRAIAAAAGGSPERLFRDLGRHSAAVNLSGVYKGFISTEPHRFFEQMGLLHTKFQNFGRFRYDNTGERSGRITLEGYTEYSPVYCASAVGYFDEALRMMHAPGPVIVRETSCHCAGDAQCIYEMSW
jgi:hypothetical protein